MNSPPGTLLVPSLKAGSTNSGTDEMRKTAEEWLYCTLSGSSFFDKSQPILGYPLDIRTDEFGYCWTTPVVEMISYDTFIKQVKESPEKQKDYENTRFKSSFGDSYNFWIPVYINEEHWEAAYEHIHFAITVARKGFVSSNNDSFTPQMALKVLIGILNKIAGQLLQSRNEQTKAAIQAFSHFYYLLARFIVEYPELQEDIDDLVDTTRTSEESRSKEDISDIGEFLVKLSLSKFGLQNASLNLALLEEYLARQVGWVLKADPKFLQQEWNLQSFVKAFISKSRMSHQTIAVLLETLKLFSNIGLDDDFSILSAKTLETHSKKVSVVNGNWETLVSNFNLNSSIRREEDMAKVIQKAFEISTKNEYTLNATIPSFQNSRKKYEAIPYNPNFNFFNRATTLSATDSSASKNSNTNKPQTTTTTTKVSAIMSTATWDEIKTELKGFEANPIIEIIIPDKKKPNRKNGVAKKSGKYFEESKGRRDYYVYYVKKEDAKSTQVKKTSTNNSTAENSMTQEYEDFIGGSQKKKSDELYFFNFGKTSNKQKNDGKVKSKPKANKIKW